MLTTSILFERATHFSLFFIDPNLENTVLFSGKVPVVKLVKNLGERYHSLS